MKATFLIVAVVLSLSANAQHKSAKIQDNPKMEQKGNKMIKDDKMVKDDKMMKGGNKAKMKKVKVKMKRDESMMNKSKM